MKFLKNCLVFMLIFLLQGSNEKEEMRCENDLECISKFKLIIEEKQCHVTITKQSVPDEVNHRMPGMAFVHYQNQQNHQIEFITKEENKKDVEMEYVKKELLTGLMNLNYELKNLSQNKEISFSLLPQKKIQKAKTLTQQKQVLEPSSSKKLIRSKTISLIKQSEEKVKPPESNLSISTKDITITKESYSNYLYSTLNLHFFIFIHSSPCFSCLENYNRLASNFPNVVFNIFYSTLYGNSNYKPYFSKQFPKNSVFSECRRRYVSERGSCVWNLYKKIIKNGKKLKNIIFHEVTLNKKCFEFNSHINDILQN